MKLSFHLERKPGLWESIFVAAIMTGIIGLSWLSSLGRWTALFAFDAISIAFRNSPPTDVVLVCLDERSHEVLQQPYDRPWDRRLHARLVERLRNEGARLVFFDIVFERPKLDTSAEAEFAAADEEFAAAIQRSGNVILGGNIADAQEAEGIQRRVIAPDPLLRQAARAWGVLSFYPIDSDSGVRRVPERIQTIEHSAQHAARLLGASAEIAQAPASPRWMRYFGPPGSFAAVSYHQALTPEGVPPAYFRDRIVLVGTRFSTGFTGSGKDTFATPYSRFGGASMSGVEVHANLLSTLREDGALRRLPARLEIALLLCNSIGIAWLLLGLRPTAASIVALTTMCFSAMGSWAAAAEWKVWGDWFLLAGVAVPTALILSIGRNYYIERSRREKITRAFEKYLSPEMVRNVVSSRIDLKPGGTTRRITAMMTDIEGYSSLAETRSAKEVSDILITYFTRLTRHVFDHKGTIVQFVGDGTYCVWGAPLDQPNQADLALKSALAIQASMQGMSFEHYPLRTRIGISTGNGLCGNLGSIDRFDYTVLGDNTNLAARIEGANKKLGTRVLLSESTKRALQDEWVLRDVGDFLVAGRVHPVRLWEPIAKGSNVPDDWAHSLPLFAKGLAAWRRGDWQQAEVFFNSSLEQRGSQGDGPADFYLKRLPEARLGAGAGPIKL